MQVLNAELDNHETPGRFEALGSIAKHLPLGLDTHANERISGFHGERNIALGAVFGLRQVGNGGSRTIDAPLGPQCPGDVSSPASIRRSATSARDFHSV